MSKEKISLDMSTRDVLLTMSEGVIGSLKLLMEMLNDQDFIPNILLLDSLDIRGSKIWKLYNDCCDRDKEKFRRTLMTFRYGAFNEDEIQTNLSLDYALPFLSDSTRVKISDEKFGPYHPDWEKYVLSQKRSFRRKLHARMKLEKNTEIQHSL